MGGRQEDGRWPTAGRRKQAAGRPVVSRPGCRRAGGRPVDRRRWPAPAGWSGGGRPVAGRGGRPVAGRWSTGGRPVAGRAGRPVAGTTRPPAAGGGARPGRGTPRSATPARAPAARGHGRPWGESSASPLYNLQNILAQATPGVQRVSETPLFLGQGTVRVGRAAGRALRAQAPHARTHLRSNSKSTRANSTKLHPWGFSMMTKPSTMVPRRDSATAGPPHPAAAPPPRPNLSPKRPKPIKLRPQGFPITRNHLMGVPEIDSKENA